MTPDQFLISDAAGLRVKLMDFQAGVETLTTEFTPASSSTGSDSDVTFLLDAPAGYRAGLDGSSTSFFLDREPVSRKLAPKYFQLVYAPSRFASDFRTWAQQVCWAVRECLFSTGLVCVDFADFRTALDASPGAQLVVNIISFDEPSELPAMLSTSTRFRALYSNILGGPELSLPFYTEVERALESRSPNMVVHKFGMKIANVQRPQLVLLGEPA